MSPGVRYGHVLSRRRRPGFGFGFGFGFGLRSP